MKKSKTINDKYIVTIKPNIDIYYYIICICKISNDVWKLKGYFEYTESEVERLKKIEGMKKVNKKHTKFAHKFQSLYDGLVMVSEKKGKYDKHLLKVSSNCKLSKSKLKKYIKTFTDEHVYKHSISIILRQRLENAKNEDLIDEDII